MSYPLWRLATSEANLEFGWFQNLGLPECTNDFQTFAVRVPRGDGDQAVHGYQSDTLVWNDLDSKPLTILQGIVNEVRNNGGIVFATVPRLNGDGGVGWIDVSGFAYILDITRNTERVINRRVAAGVTLQINNITVLNDPSTAV